jgi:O-antigen ligase
MITEKYIKRVVVLLIIMLLIKIGGYYTISENVAITRVFKVFARIMMTVGAFTLFNKLKNKGIYGYVSINSPLPILLYIAFLFLALVSILWSTKPSYSALQWVMYLDSFVFSYLFIKIIIVLQYHYKTRIDLSYIFSIAVTIISAIFLIGFFTSPDDFLRATHGGEVERLGGYFMNPNELGMMSVVGIATNIIAFMNNKRTGVFIFLLAINLTVLILTGSRSSMIGFMLILFYLVSRSSNRKLKLTVYGTMIASVPLIINLIFIKQGDLEEVMSMTGRLPFWSALLNEGIIKEPWFGFGFMRIAYTDSFESVHTYAGKMTHNTFIQVLMNLGFAGLFIALMQLFSTIFMAFNKVNEKHKIFFIGVFIPILINSFTEFGIFGEANFGTLFYQLLIFALCIKWNNKLTIKQRMKLNESTSLINQ